MTDSSVAGAGASALYRAVWRWHFYAGLIVLPFMILIAITGGLYLFKDEINNAFYGDLRIVEPQESAPLPASTLVASALAYSPGKVKTYRPLRVGPSGGGEDRQRRQRQRHHLCESI